MSVIFLVGKQPRLEIGAAAIQNAIAKIEDLIDRTSAMGQESLGVTHQEWERLKDGFELDSTHLINIHCNTNNTLPCLDALNSLQGLDKVLETYENI